MKRKVTLSEIVMLLFCFCWLDLHLIRPTNKINNSTHKTFDQISIHFVFHLHLFASNYSTTKEKKCGQIMPMMTVWVDKKILTLNGTACFACWASTRLKSIFRLGNDIILVKFWRRVFCCVNSFKLSRKCCRSRKKFNRMCSACFHNFFMYKQ